MEGEPYQAMVIWFVDFLKSVPFVRCRKLPVPAILHATITRTLLS